MPSEGKDYADKYGQDFLHATAALVHNHLQKYIVNIQLKYNDTSIVNHKNGFLVSFDGLEIFIESAEEFFIVNEIFIENDYGFSTSEKVILIDIGANVGIASLFFSKLECVQKVYAFEPVLDTYNQAKYNLKLNEAISKVVSLNNFGLGESDREETFVFDKNVKGNTGIRGKLSNSYLNNVTTIEVKVEIKNASEQINKIVKENPDTKIVIKMDCEGAEYEIFDDISKSGCINNIDMFILEWHDKGPSSIENILTKNQFNLFSRVLAPNAGMIYAYKTKI